MRADLVDIANNWTIVIGIGTIITLVLYWSQEAYLKPIIRDEDKIKEKLKKDTSNKIDSIREYVENNDEARFVDELYTFIILKENLKSLKDIFRGKMVPCSLIVMVLTIGLVTLWEFNNVILDALLIYLLIIIAMAVMGNFSKLRKYERRLSRYLDDDDPEDLF